VYLFSVNGYVLFFLIKIKLHNTGCFFFMWHKIVDEYVTPLVCLTQVRRLIKSDVGGSLVLEWGS
jgi:hypothetical protein